MKSKCSVLDIPAFKSVPFTLLLLVSLCRKGKTVEHRRTLQMVSHHGEEEVPNIQYRFQDN